MNASIGWLAGLILVLSLSSPAHSQEKPLSGKIGLIDVGELFQKCDRPRAAKIEKEINAVLDPLRVEVDAIRKSRRLLEPIFADVNTPPAQRETIRLQLRDGQRRIEDLDLIARNAIGKTMVPPVLAFYEDISAAIRAHAEENDLDVVFVHGNGIKTEPWNVPVAPVTSHGIIDRRNFIYIRGRNDLTATLLLGLHESRFQPGIDVVYAREGVDITSAVIRRMEK